MTVAHCRLIRRARTWPRTEGLLIQPLCHPLLIHPYPFP